MKVEKKEYKDVMLAPGNEEVTEKLVAKKRQQIPLVFGGSENLLFGTFALSCALSRMGVGLYGVDLAWLSRVVALEGAFGGFRRDSVLGVWGFAGSVLSRRAFRRCEAAGLIAFDAEGVYIPREGLELLDRLCEAAMEVYEGGDDLIRAYFPAWG